VFSSRARVYDKNFAWMDSVVLGSSKISFSFFFILSLKFVVFYSIGQRTKYKQMSVLRWRLSLSTVNYYSRIIIFPRKTVVLDISRITIAARLRAEGALNFPPSKTLKRMHTRVWDEYATTHSWANSHPKVVSKISMSLGTIRVFHEI